MIPFVASGTLRSTCRLSIGSSDVWFAGLNYTLCTHKVRITVSCYTTPAASGFFRLHCLQTTRSRRCAPEDCLAVWPSYTMRR